MAEPLPELVDFSDYGNDWEKYLNAIYEIYMKHIVNAGLSYHGLPVKYRFLPPTDGKGFGFWHLISEGEDEENRTPDLRRCERILWVAWILRQAGTNPDILWYENKRGSNTHVVLWYPLNHYALILAKRSGYYLLKSAYVIMPHREKTFEKEWREYWGKG